MRREDGTKGIVKFRLFCNSCRENVPQNLIYFHEFIWRDGKVWLAASEFTFPFPWRWSPEVSPHRPQNIVSCLLMFGPTAHFPHRKMVI